MFKEISILVLSLAGIFIAGYLVYKHAKKQPLVCPIGDSCTQVTESRWSETFGIRNDTMGLAFYIAVFLSGIALFLSPSFNALFFTYFPYIEGAAVLFSAYLIYIQGFIIKNWCFWCMASAIINLMLLLTVIL